MTPPDIGLIRLMQVLESLGIQFMIGGSLASSIHGLLRATRDIDIIARIDPGQIGELVCQLSPDFYADEDQMRDALSHGRAFNLIHYASAYKFDLFPLPEEAYSQEQFRRRVSEHSSQFGIEVDLPVVSPEDIILTKLAWYRAGGGMSERQWSDVLGVISVQGKRLDVQYMRLWAVHLGVKDLLDRALAEAVG